MEALLLLGYTSECDAGCGWSTQLQRAFKEGFYTESACDVGDPGSIPGSARSLGKGIGYPLWCSWASPVAQLVKNPPAVRDTWVRSLGWEDPLEKGKATHSSILAWGIPWTVHGVSKSRARLSDFHFSLYTEGEEKTPKTNEAVMYSGDSQTSSVKGPIINPLGPSLSVAITAPTCGQVLSDSCDPTDCSPPGSSVHGILQARIQEWAASSSSGEPPRPSDQICISCIGWWILHHWAPLGCTSVVTLQPYHESSHWQQVNERGSLGANQTLWIPKYKFHIIFMDDKIFFFSPPTI